MMSVRGHEFAATGTAAPPQPRSRPYVVLHNLASLDGRLAGFPTDAALYSEVASRLPHDAVLTSDITLLAAAEESGVDLCDAAVTGDDLDEDDLARPVAAGMATGLPWLVVVDSTGRLPGLGWWRRQPYWRDVIVLCGSDVSDLNRARLRRLGVSHIVSGGRRVDLAAALEELHAAFGVTSVRVDAGGMLNGVLLRAGLVDEVSVVIAPWTVGRRGAPGPLLAEGLDEDASQRLVLQSVERLPRDHVWLRYTVR